MFFPYSMICEEFQLPQIFGFTRIKVIMEKSVRKSH